jgi:hypothetical protein
LGKSKTKVVGDEMDVRKQLLIGHDTGESESIADSDDSDDESAHTTKTTLDLWDKIGRAYKQKVDGA